MKKYSISLAKLNAPRDICHIMESCEIKYYNYEFALNGGIIFNIGKAADNEWMSGTWGNRIYRKAGGISGWVWPMHCSSSKKMKELMQKYLPTVHKDDVIITVYDRTLELQNQPQIDIDRFLLNEEHKLIKEYQSVWGSTPLLNIQRTRIRPDYTDTFNKLFEEIV